MTKSKATNTKDESYHKVVKRGLRKKLTTEERFVHKQTRKNLYISAYLLIGIGAILFLSLLIQVVNNVGIVAWDHALQVWFVSIRNSTLTSIAIFFAVAFGPVVLPILIVAITALWIIFSKHAWRPLLLAGAMTLGLIWIQVITRLVQRPRPPVDLMLFGQDTTFSFPSGHVSGTTDFLLVLGYLIVSRNPTKKRITIAALIAFIGISSQVFSRVYLGYHWLSDTLASICLGLIILGIVIAVDTWRTVRIPGEKVTGKLSKVQTENT